MNCNKSEMFIRHIESNVMAEIKDNVISDEAVVRGDSLVFWGE